MLSQRLWETKQGLDDGSYLEEPSSRDNCDELVRKCLKGTGVKLAEKLQDHALKTFWFNDIVAARVGFTSADALNVLTVLDTEPAPNFIHRDAFPGLKITPLAQTSIRLQEPGGHVLRICGTTVMKV